MTPLGSPQPPPMAPGNPWTPRSPPSPISTPPALTYLPIDDVNDRLKDTDRQLGGKEKKIYFWGPSPTLGGGEGDSGCPPCARTPPHLSSTHICVLRHGVQLKEEGALDDLTNLGDRGSSVRMGCTHTHALLHPSSTTHLLVDVDVRGVGGAPGRVPAQELQLLEHLLDWVGVGPEWAGGWAREGDPTHPPRAINRHHLYPSPNRRYHPSPKTPPSNAI